MPFWEMTIVMGIQISKLKKVKSMEKFILNSDGTLP